MAVPSAWCPLLWLSSVAVLSRESHAADAVFGAPLPEVASVSSQKGALRTSLILGPMDIIAPQASLASRAINQSIPGPTLIVRPGDHLSIRFLNALQAPAGQEIVNGFHGPNRTNLHVHGLHVSPVAPGDDVLGVALGPGEHYGYEYDLPSDHSPGTYWYHPHFHGSTTIQSGAGAAGALLVADPPGYLSPQLEAMRDRVVVLQEFPTPLLTSIAQKSGDKLFDVTGLTDEQEQDFWLANGAANPVISLQPGEWQRLRFVVAGVSNWLSMSFGNCTVALLAKDGIYIQDFPRLVDRIQVPQGGRADVVVRCPAASGAAATDHVVSSQKAPTGAKSFQGPVLTLRVEGAPAKGLVADELKPWAPASRPRYLQDLTAVANPACSCSTSMGLGGNNRWMEGHLWQGKHHYLHQSPRNAVVERRLSGIGVHQYHQHTYPFQLFQTPAGNDSYFQRGDWHDTYLNVKDSRMLIRYSTVDYYGPQVVHCHNPAHSDAGMLAVELVSAHATADQCGCDLLGQPPPGGRYAAVPENVDLLNVSALACFAVMLALFIVVALRIPTMFRMALAGERNGFQCSAEQQSTEYVKLVAP